MSFPLSIDYSLFYRTPTRAFLSVIIMLIICFFVFNLGLTGSLIIPFWTVQKKRVDEYGFIGAMRPNMVESGQANIAREDDNVSWNARALSGDFKDVRGRHEFRPKRADAQLLAHNL